MPRDTRTTTYLEFVHGALFQVRHQGPQRVDLRVLDRRVGGGSMQVRVFRLEDRHARQDALVLGPQRLDQQVSLLGQLFQLLVPDEFRPQEVHFGLIRPTAPAVAAVAAVAAAALLQCLFGGRCLLPGQLQVTGQLLVLALHFRELLLQARGLAVLDFRRHWRYRRP